MRWTAGVHRAGLLEMTGDLDGAVQAAEEAFVHGTDAGQPDAVLFHSALTGIVTMWRDDHRTLVESLESIHSVFPDVPGLTPFLALMLVRAGRRDDGLALVRDELAAPLRMSRDGTTLTGWAVLADIAGLTGSSEHAPALLEALWPTRDTVVGNGIVWNESGAVRVGLVQVLLGDWAGAEASFDVADDIARRLRAPLWQAIAATERAKLHALRGERGDRDRCLALLDEAAELAEPRGALLLRHRGDLVRDVLDR